MTSWFAVNRLLREGASVFWLGDRTIGSPAKPARLRARRRQGADILATAAQQLGVTVTAAATEPGSLVMKGRPEGRPLPTLQLHPVRIALWDQYGGSVAVDGFAGCSSATVFRSIVSMRKP